MAHNYYNLPRAEFHTLAILLLEIYNCEIIEPSTDSIDQSRLKTLEIRVISLAKPSIYHEPNAHTTSSIQTSAPTEQNLSRLFTDSRISIFGPFEEVQRLLASNYMQVCTVLLKVYNHHITQLGTISHGSLCRYFHKLLKQGMNIDIKEKIKEFINDNDNQSTNTTNTAQQAQPQSFRENKYQLNNNNFSSLDHADTISDAHGFVPSQSSPALCLLLPRSSIQIQFDSPFLVELTRSVYYCFYNNFADIALEMFDNITKKATLKLYPDVLLVCLFH